MAGAQRPLGSTGSRRPETSRPAGLCGCPRSGTRSGRFRAGPQIGKPGVITAAGRRVGKMRHSDSGQPSRFPTPLHAPMTAAPPRASMNSDVCNGPRGTEHGPSRHFSDGRRVQREGVTCPRSPGEVDSAGTSLGPSTRPRALVHVSRLCRHERRVSGGPQEPPPQGEMRVEKLQCSCVPGLWAARGGQLLLPELPAPTPTHPAGAEAARPQGSFPDPQTRQVEPTSQPHWQLG